MKELYSTMSYDICDMLDVVRHCLSQYREFFAELSAEGAENLKKFEDDNPVLMKAYNELDQINGWLEFLYLSLNPMADKEQEGLDDIDPN